MTYTSVLVHVEPRAATTPRLVCAAAVAHRFDALLMGVGAEMLQTAVIADPYGMVSADWQVAVVEQLDEHMKASEAAFKRHAEGLRSSWRAGIEAPASAICRAAAGADLIVLGGAPLDGGHPDWSADVAEVVMRSGRPVLVAPPVERTFHGDRVLVAWKNTREARRALADALPFLKRAEAVVVMEICAAEDEEAAKTGVDAVIAHLKRHGVEASAVVVAAPDEKAGVSLNSQAQSMRADLIVAGCYGHSRFREWAFGGVTRGLLREPEQFVLLSH